MKNTFARTVGGRNGSWLQVVLLMAFLTAIAAPSTAAPLVWVVPSLERVGPEDAAGQEAEIALCSAKGEFESFQIVVSAPSGGLTGVNVFPPDLSGLEFTLYREHYVYVSEGSQDYPSNRNRPLGPGWYPDGLIPFADPETGEDLVGASLDAVPFNVAEGTNQPIWVDVYVESDASAGTHRGEFTVSSDQGEASVELAHTVWDFELPHRAALKSSFGTNGDSRLKAEELLRNRVNPRTVDIADERVLIDTAGLACRSTGFWSGADVETCEMGPAPSVAAVQAEIEQHEDDLFLYNYTADEVGACPSIYEPLKAWARSLHQGGVDSLVTMAPTPELYSDGSGSGRSAVDIWVVLPKMYRNTSNRIAYVLRKGDEVWSYNCLNQDDYSPKWEIDFAPINYRIQPGFISQSLGITGLLYWRVDLWTAEPWSDVAEYSPAYPGEGMLVYPGEQVGLSGVVPSVRLKWIRDGVDDYDYIQLLKDRGFENWALGIVGGVGPDWEDWTRDPTELEMARVLLGKQMGATFLDVFADQWAFDAIEAISQADIVQGYPDARYRPNRDVTRAQMSVFIARSVVQPFGDEGLSEYQPPEAPTFNDVPPTYWCYKHVELLAEENIVAGYPDGRYRPSAQVTRDQMAVYIARSIVTPRGEEGLADYVPPTTPTFTDVSPEFWAYPKIEYLAEEEVVSGYGDGLYRPNWAVTRDQMAVYIGRAFGVFS